jgi:predicted RNA-binding protein with PUA-like domain
MSKVWLFQINPKEKGTPNLRVGGSDDWAVTRYRNEITPEDTAIIWREGEQGGIIGLGTVSSEAFYKDDPAVPDKKFWVTIRYTHMFSKPLLRSVIKQNPQLHYMQIISISFAQNPFAVTEDEWSELLQLLDLQ